MFRNLSIRVALLLVLLFFTGALLVSVGVGWVGTRAGVVAGEVQDRTTRDMLALKQAEIRMWDNRVALAVGHRNVLRGDPPDSVRSQTTRAEKSMQEARPILQSVAQGLPADWSQERQLAASMLTAFDAYAALVQRGAVGLAGGNEAEYSGKEIVAQRNKLLADMEGLMKQLFEAEGQRGSELQAQSVRLLKIAEVAAGVLMVVGVVLALLCWMFIRRNVLAPLDEAGALLETVAQGDLTTRIEVRSTNEIGRLMGAARTMQEGLARMVTQVRQGVEEIHTGSREIALGNGDLSGRTEQQAASLEETAASMEQLSSTVKQNADSARQANQLAASSMAVAQRGGAAVGEVVATMQAISDSSRRIADIVTVIDGIAFQTNILALNAAVEAARAGEQGRGFAVVASEVRALAQRSASAAKEIKGLIDESVGKVGAGSTQVERAGATMQEIVASVQRVTDIMGEISAASIEQSSGIDQVNQAVVQMDQATQQNAALVEESAAAASSLEEQAKRLREAVSQFRVAAGAVPLAAAVRPPAAVSAPVRSAASAPARVASRPAPARPAISAPPNKPRAPSPSTAAASAPAHPKPASPAPALSAPAAKPKAPAAHKPAAPSAKPAAPRAAPAAASRSDDDWETF